VADRHRRGLGLDAPRIFAPRERREVVAGDGAEPRDQRRLRVARDVADRRQASIYRLHRG
jgi:hypothetical protein